MVTDEGIVDEDTLPALFRRAVTAHPNRSALRSRDAELSYQQLDIATNRVANALIERSSAPHQRIAILMQHDLPQVIALLGVLKAGQIVAALNPTHPETRLRQLANDAEATLIIVDNTNEQLGTELASTDRKLVRYDDLIAHQSTVVPPNSIRGEHGAALIYTSGSTGHPKAVVQTHRQICRNAEIHTEAMQYSVADRLPLFGSISGSQGITTVFCALRNGAAVCPFALTVKGVTGLAQWMTDLSITVYASSASTFRNFMMTIDNDYRFIGVRAVRLASEPATSDDFRMFQRHFSSDCIFVHTLSTSETCTIAWSRRTARDVVPEGRLPIGFPSRGQDLILRDAAGSAVPVGEVGEITIRSKYVAAGYWRNDAATAERFSPPLDESGTRLVRTGDIGRINHDGMLEFIGRTDDRVKIRGNRIELTEIESAIHSIAGVRQAVVEAITRTGQEPLLVGFVAEKPGLIWSPAALRRALRNKLPDHMVPSRFVRIDAFPFAPTGKIDREALRKSYSSHKTAARIDMPHTDMERFLAELWCESFELAEVDRQDNFFDLGGDSLIAAVMSARIHSTFGIEAELATFFDFPTLAELAREIDSFGRAAEHTTSVEPPRVRPSEFPLTYGQESVWALRSFASSFTMSCCSRIAGPLDVPALERCINEIVDRHETFRTSFADRNGQPVQVVHPAKEMRLSFCDFGGDPDPEVKAGGIWMTEQAKVFDLTQPPLVQFALVRLREGEHWFIYTAHAILLDGVAWDIFFKELRELYDAYTRRATPSLRPAPQYGDYALWQRDVFAPGGERYKSSFEWWVNQILQASYPDNPGYRRVLLWCIKARDVTPRFAKQLIGMVLRYVVSAPRPSRPELPFKRTALVHDIAPGGGVIKWGLSPDVSHRLDLLGRQERTSGYLTRLTAYIAMLAGETGNSNVTIYVSLSNRASASTRDVFGCCATSALLQLRCDGNDTFRQFISSVRDHLRMMQRHAEVPYHRIYREMRDWRIKMPEGRTVLTSAWTHPTFRCGDIEVTCVPNRNAMPPPLQLDTKFDLENETYNCSVVFDGRRYDPEKVCGFVGRFKAFLDVVSHSPDTPIRDALSSTREAAPI